MSLVFRRFKSKMVSAATQQIALDTLARSRGVSTVRKQLLDPYQLQRLSLALNRHLLYRDQAIHEKVPPAGTPIPPGYHLVYFTPAVLSSDLGSDGTEIAYSPEQPFTRRMWAGGELLWDKEIRLRVGEEVTEVTQLLSAVPKVTRSGEEMIVIRLQKTFETPKGVALIDKRDWVFRTRLTEAQIVPKSCTLVSVPLPAANSHGGEIRDFLQTSVSLFRFSALTFNAHKLHYSRPWCIEVEGHRDVLVHGPLNLINMLDFWRDTRRSGDYEVPQSIRYRATAPFYCDEPYRATLEEGDKGSAHVKLWAMHEGEMQVGMIGDLVALPDAS